MKQAFSLAVIALMPTVTHADWQPDKITLAFGQFIAPFDDRQADINQYRLALAWDLSDSLWTSESLLLQSYAELALGNWKSTLNPMRNSYRVGADSVKQISFSPVFRFTGNGLLIGQTSPFLDLGVGVSYQSEKDIEQQDFSGINMGRRWQFETRAMVGLTLGEGNPFEVSYGWMHYSNADLKDDNEGLDFQTLQLAYRF
ncbi:acyloxyacyl hydrolase [Thalassotalea sp. G20_0]|uniref:acyloxyacyl hydrolase n=1 Tax=Thalassotalea sp. G20_0 TaxID=2821093 RepID=UPI001AD995A1|nr:acyloxyacyl hydrolase [Thalassotalea sp. G20_0]MBO9496151.1 acyloxyacyl hydrolase [Thalassotalea sp. G20_0]